MKIRQDFVTNSSSSNFIIAKPFITEDQTNLLLNGKKIAEELNLEYAEWYWDIIVGELYVEGKTIMDNFDMSTFLDEVVKVRPEVIRWRTD